MNGEIIRDVAPAVEAVWNRAAADGPADACQKAMCPDEIAFIESQRR